MLTDSEAQVLSPYIIEDESYYAWNEGAESVRDHYENLITQGRLRVVEEVELVADDFDDGGVQGSWRCSGCGYKVAAEYYNLYSAATPAHHDFCPCCGGKIQAP
jgi:hypothetical protein